MLFRVGIEMEPFRREDNDAFLHDIICEGREDAEYDSGQYLNDTSEGDADCWHFLSRYLVCDDLGNNLRIACWWSLVQSLEMRAPNPS